jgi:hypothetical protein
MATSGVVRRVLAWLADRGGEGLWQAAVLALVGGGSVSAIFKSLPTPNVFMVIGTGGLTAVVIFLVYMWVRGRNGSLAVLAPGGSDSPATSHEAVVYAPRGGERLDGIAIVRSCELRSTGGYIDCTCAVVFYGFSAGVSASPNELRITGKGERDELAILKTSSPAQTSDRLYDGVTMYRGRIHSSGFAALAAAVRREMGEGFGDVAVPPNRPTFCRIEIRLPEGEALATHLRSKIRLGFELDVSDGKQEMLVRLT